MKKGISVGKSYFWANTTIDAYVMVDSRLMKSMITCMAKHNIILIDYFKLFNQFGKILILNKSMLSSSHSTMEHIVELLKLNKYNKVIEIIKNGVSVFADFKSYYELVLLFHGFDHNVIFDIKNVLLVVQWIENNKNIDVDNYNYIYTYLHSLYHQDQSTDLNNFDIISKVKSLELFFSDSIFFN